MACCRNMDTGQYIPGVWDPSAKDGTGGYKTVGRPSWNVILGQEGVVFVSDMLKRMIDYEISHKMLPLKLTQEESAKWHYACSRCFTEGWDRFYFDKNGELCCTSRIQVERWREEPADFFPKKTEEQAPLTLEGMDEFVKEG